MGREKGVCVMCGWDVRGHVVDLNTEYYRWKLECALCAGEGESFGEFCDRERRKGIILY